MNNYYENDWNVILGVDSYKVSHQLLLPKGLEQLEDYAESRGGAYPHIVFAGFQPILKMIEGVQVTTEMIDEAEFLLTKHFGSEKIFDRKLWEVIVDKYNGKLPIKIYAVPEGSVVPTKHILFKVVSLEEQFVDLAAYLETLLMRVW